MKVIPTLRLNLKCPYVILKKNPTKEDEKAYINNVKVLLSIIKIEKWSQENN